MEEDILIKKVKRDDDDALRALISNYEKMIYKIIHSFRLSQGDYRISMDELFQEGTIALYEACKSYNKRTDCKFSTFAFLVIKRRINKVIFSNLRIYRSECMSIDKDDHFQNSFAFEAKYVEDNPVSYQNKLQNQDELDSILKNLNDFDRKLVRLRLEDVPYAEISRIMKVPYRKLDNRMQYLKKRQFYRKKKPID